ncbi:hypothetical protein [Solibacillus cecembensis]
MVIQLVTINNSATLSSQFGANKKPLIVGPINGFNKREKSFI